MKAAASCPSWHVSIVSHGHGDSTLGPIRDIHHRLGHRPHRIVLTLNAGEDDAFLGSLSDRIRNHIDVIRNASPRGFAANHNAVGLTATSDFLLLADPDLRVHEPIFAPLEARLMSDAVGIASPVAMNSEGEVEDNGRSLFSPLDLLTRHTQSGRQAVSNHQVAVETVDWVAGLCMAMRSDTFQRVGGFDERFHMYCEDVDLCLRVKALGKSIERLHDIRVIHDARRRTLKSPRHFYWHLQSLLRLWRSAPYREARVRTR